MEDTIDIKTINEKIERESAFVDLLMLEMNKVIVGQKHMVERLLIGLLGQGHILLEGVPGLAKTLAINTLAQAVHGSFSRIQFTPDLLPADVTGTLIYNMKANDFSIKKGPIFANFVLADEINRAPAKVQSALLEAMQEKQVTIGDETFVLDKPFLVMATQNPVEQEGTYPLPEAQVDRFMLKTVIDYPKIAEEQLIMRANMKGAWDKVNPVVSVEQILKAQQVVREVYMDEKIEKYILDIVFATRYPEKYKLADLKPLISFGASPRGSINLATAAKCYAFIKR
ncbi:MAG TPA: AAA family ATPase, partial [Mariniflexile sp.]|nr:AAA family ATPase [Mariniflexile sp.]